MAELPEVEILVRDMRELVVGRAIQTVAIPRPEVLRFPTPAEFTELLVGRSFIGVERKAKQIVCQISGGLLLAMHMMLDGTLRLAPTGTPPDVDTLLVYGLEGDEDLQLRDRKGYARAAAGPPAEVVARLRLDELGPEMLDPTFTSADLLARLRKRRGKLKTTLVDQKILAGLGNRDADESLWHAHIHPLRPAGSLSEAEAELLLVAIRAVLNEGIDLRGTMTDLRGQRGSARQRRNVYGRPNEPCPRCGTPMARTWLGQLVTHWCPRCQPELAGG